MPRSHKNKTSRLTARERASAFIDRYWPSDNLTAEDALTRLLGAHAREALDRARRRRTSDKQLANALGAKVLR